MALISSVLAIVGALGAPAQDATVSLGRVFVKNEKLAYEVKSDLSGQFRMRGLQTWIPNDLELSYGFTTRIEELKPDGIAVMRYERPNVHQIQGETFNSPPKETDEKVGMIYQLTVSPLNEILAEKDLNPKPDKPSKDKDSDSGWIFPSANSRQVMIGGILGDFVVDLYRLSMFVGSMDSSLDFAPRTPIDALKVGDSWKRTVGYQPQKLKGKGNQQAVQRLDFTYTFKGLQDSEGKKVYRVEGVLNLNTDLVAFVNQLAGPRADETGLKKFPMTMKSTILFDLDPKTKNTILAQASTEAGFSIYVTEYPDDPVIEQKIKSHTTMRLVGDRMAPPDKKG